MDGHIVVFTTAQNQDAALQIADAVVSEGLAACCSMLPGMRSIYMWKGELYDEEEVFCIIKTRAGLFDALKARILELHAYEVPEVIAIEIKDGHSDYLNWINQVTAR